MQKYILRLFVSVVSLLVAAPSWAHITPLPLKSTLASHKPFAAKSPVMPCKAEPARLYHCSNQVITL